jgi:hypothetical protein
MWLTVQRLFDNRFRMHSMLKVKGIAHMQATTPMTWERLKEKLRAHGMPGWRDEQPRPTLQDASTVQLGASESESGSAGASSKKSPDADR